MSIEIQYTPTDYEVGFLFGRMYIFDHSKWYPCVTNFCPHLNLGQNECLDCSLALESEDDY